ncbi:GyrI-like domain-containing protein [Devosia sp. A16]|uniref:GyrI-like domain-containing protein n=1 Tax=Devosia sp. A16 TaxID=1736675 RepID=UPI0006D82AEE|nr:GyrI-like domain-containing protein [Devosia sp. A16]
MADPVVVELKPRPFAYINLRSTLPQMSATMGQGFATLSQMFARAKAQMAGNPLAHYTDFDATAASFELGFPVLEADIPALRAAGLSIGQSPGGTNMTATHVGPYDTVARTYDLMTIAMKAQKLSPGKDMWESYMSPPETPPEQIRTEVIWPVHAAG